MEIFLRLDNFEGPLDLLLNLIEKKKLSISEICIYKLIDEYLEIIGKEKSLGNMEIKAEFLVVASELIEIKTMALLNLDKNKEKEKELIRRLEDYRIFKEVTKKISELENEFRVAYSRGEAVREIKKIKKDYELKDLNTNDIYESFSKYVKEKEQHIFVMNINEYSLQDEMDTIYLRVLSQDKSIDEIFETAKDKMHLIYMFLAILELYKDGKIQIFNHKIKIN